MNRITLVHEVIINKRDWSIVTTISKCCKQLMASGAGAEARKVMGMTVFSGMLVATVIGILIVPALYVFIETLSRRGKGPKVVADTASGGDA